MLISSKVSNEILVYSSALWNLKRKIDKKKRPIKTPFKGTFISQTTRYAGNPMTANFTLIGRELLYQAIVPLFVHVPVLYSTIECNCQHVVLQDLLYRYNIIRSGIYI